MPDQQSSTRGRLLTAIDALVEVVARRAFRAVVEETNDDKQVREGFASALVDFMVAHRIDRKDLGGPLKLSGQTIYRWEQLQTRPTVANLQALREYIVKTTDFGRRATERNRPRIEAWLWDDILLEENAAKRVWIFRTDAFEEGSGSLVGPATQVLETITTSETQFVYVFPKNSEAARSFDDFAKLTRAYALNLPAESMKPNLQNVIGVELRGPALVATDGDFEGSWKTPYIFALSPWAVYVFLEYAQVTDQLRALYMLVKFDEASVSFPSDDQPNPVGGTPIKAWVALDAYTASAFDRDVIRKLQWVLDDGENAALGIRVIHISQEEVGSDDRPQ